MWIIRHKCHGKIVRRHTSGKINVDGFPTTVGDKIKINMNDLSFKWRNYDDGCYRVYTCRDIHSSSLQLNFWLFHNSHKDRHKYSGEL